MPALGNNLNFAGYEARNVVIENGNPNPAGTKKGQLFFNNSDNTLWYWDGTVWVAAKSGAPSGTAGGDLAGSFPNPTIALLAVTDAKVAAANKDGAVGVPSMRTLGTGAQQAAAGNDSRLSDSRTPSGAAGGDLSGTYPTPQIAAGAVVNADVNAAAAIARSKLATDPLARANHTGTQLAATISNFDTQVRTSTLNQMAAPTAGVAMNNQKLTGLADGTAANDAVSKQQLDAVASGLDIKGSVRAASTATVTLATPGATIDGVTLVAGDRVLLKNQTAPAENGIWVWNGAAVPMTRATDADSSAEVNAGLFTFVEEGTTNDNSGWVLSTNNPITLGTTGLAFTQFSGAGNYTGGNGLTLTGSDFAVNVDNSSIEINADTLRVKALGIVGAMIANATIDLTTKVTGTLPLTNGGTGQTTAKAARETGLAAAGYYSSATHGAGTTITITQATHLLRASRGLNVQVQDEATGAVVIPDIAVAANGDVTVTFGASVAANAYRTTIIG